MSHSVSWITPIYDRDYSDVIEAENWLLEEPKGCYNYTDLNRIENNTKYVMEEMLDRKIIRVPPSLSFKTNWKQSDIVDIDNMHRIIGNIILLMDLSNELIKNQFSIIYLSSQITYTLANAMEYNLYLMKNQPDLPVQKFLVKINNGIITETGTNEGYFAEDDIIHIQGVPYGEYAEHLIFTVWSGNTDDLQYVADVRAKSTTFQCQYHDVELTANFKTMLPRTLRLNGGIVYDSVGGSVRQFYAGDEITILANVATSGKRFYEWTGTQEALNNLNGGEEPSTSVLVMPDCDVTLTATYINAGQHRVTVNNGSGSGWYDYKEYVGIFADSMGPKYSFAYWSGSTGYLNDIHSSGQSFEMPDIDVSFTANYSYNYSYNTVNVIGGTIDNETMIENARELSGHTITAQVPENLGFDYWSVEGLGSFANNKSATTTFYIGDGNAVITAHFTDLRTLTKENINNSGNTTSSRVTQNKSVSVSTNEISGDYIFQKWTEGDTQLSNSYIYSFTMPERDMSIKANYRLRNQVQVTINYGNHTETITMQERSSITITADQAPEGKRFKQWNYSGLHDVNSRYNTNTTIIAGSGNGTITAIFEDNPIYHNLTVINGRTSGSYYEGQSVTCYCDTPAQGYEFINWTEGDTIVSYNSQYRFTMGTQDRTIQANYALIPYFNLTVINGTGSGTFLRNSNPTIQMDPAPEGYQFFQWEVLVGTDTDVYQPLAETTNIRNLTHDVTVRATYYVPNTDITYVLTVIDKDGTTRTYDAHIGEQVSIFASSPDEGWEFDRWSGDSQYVINRFSADTKVNMPGKNITVRAQYKRIGYTTTYHVILHSGELLVRTDEETGTEYWDYEGEFEEGAVVPIRAVGIPIDYKFNGWKAEEGDLQSETTVADLTQPNTTLTVQDFDIELTRDVIPLENYTISITDGAVSGSYHENDPVSVYFALTSTDDTHYVFKRWTGNDLAYIRLYSGGSFDIYYGGDGDIPQIIKMPNRNISIAASYDTLNHLIVNNGNNSGYYAANNSISVSANTIQGKEFSHWEGNIEYVDNVYNPNITVTMPNVPITLTAKYTTDTNRNNIGYTLTDIYSNDNININDIIIISGELDIGFIFTDINGHMYTITAINNNIANIIRLTTITRR